MSPVRCPWIRLLILRLAVSVSLGPIALFWHFQNKFGLTNELCLNHCYCKMFFLCGAMHQLRRFTIFFKIQFYCLNNRSFLMVYHVLNTTTQSEVLVLL
jgi:hypothetical protein